MKRELGKGVRRTPFPIPSVRNQGRTLVPDGHVFLLHRVDIPIVGRSSGQELEKWVD